MWAEGEASSGGYSGVGEVRRRGGADGSRNEELGIWKTEEEENSGNDSTYREKGEEDRGGGQDQKINPDKRHEMKLMTVIICCCWPSLVRFCYSSQRTHTLSAGSWSGQVLV